MYTRSNGVAETGTGDGVTWCHDGEYMTYYITVNHTVRQSYVNVMSYVNVNHMSITQTSLTSHLHTWQNPLGHVMHGRISLM